MIYMVKLLNFYSDNDDNLGLLATETNYITDYISRYIRQDKEHKEQFKGLDNKDKIKKLIVCLDSQKHEIIKYNEAKSLKYKMPDSYDEIRILRGVSRAEKVLEKIAKSTNAFEEYIPGIKKIILEAIDSFKEAGYRDIWIHQKRRLKGIGTAKLICELTMYEFTLDFVVENKENQIIYKQRMMTTPPDSLCYHSYFKTLKIDEKNINIVERICEKTIYTVFIDDILKNKEGSFKYIPEGNEIEENLGMTIIAFKKSVWYTDLLACKEAPDGMLCPKTT